MIIRYELINSSSTCKVTEKSTKHGDGPDPELEVQEVFEVACEGTEPDKAKHKIRESKHTIELSRKDV